MIAFSSPLPGREEDYLSWYRDQHMPDLLALDGIEHGTLYEIEAVSPSRPAQFVSVYELSQPPEGILGVMAQRSASGEIRQTDALDQGSAMLMFCRKKFST